MAVKDDEDPSSTETGWSHAGTRGAGQGGAAAVDRLLARVARGDQMAFASLYDEVAGTVHNLARQLVGDPSQSLDVTGDVLAEVWHTAPGFRPEDGSGMSWIMAIARRRAVGRLRATRARAGRPGARGPPIADVVRDVSERAGVSFRGEPASLPEPQRQALLLAYYGGYTQGQVADLLGVRPRTVSAWIRDGLPRLGDVMAEPGPGGG